MRDPTDRRRPRRAPRERTRGPQARSRRRFPRWRVAGVRLVGPVDAARVIDLGPAGAGIEIASGLRVGEPYAFTLRLKDANHRVRGRVRWCRLVAFDSEGGSRPVYRAGIAWSPRPIPEPE